MYCVQSVLFVLLLWSLSLSLIMLLLRLSLLFVLCLLGASSGSRGGSKTLDEQVSLNNDDNNNDDNNDNANYNNSNYNMSNNITC